MSAQAEDRLLANIRRWVELETPSRDGSAIAALADLVELQARAAGLSTWRKDLGPQVGPLLTVSHRRPGDLRAGILVLAHLDTVHPAGNLQRNPFRIDADRVYGPGSYDMKAGACVALAALIEVSGRAAVQGEPALPIDMVFVPDEEVGSAASRADIERLGATARYALVCEPARAGGRCVTARKGIGGLTLSAHGCAAHAGLNHALGRNAIRELAHQVLQLEAMTDHARGVTVNIGTIEGGTTPNVVPDLCRLTGEFRMPTQALADALQQRLQSLQPHTADVTLEAKAWIKRPPYEKTDAAAALLAQAQTFAADAGFALDDVPMTGGASDGNFTAALGVPTLDGLGVPGDGAHTLHEHFHLSSLAPRLAFWTSLLKDLS